MVTYLTYIIYEGIHAFTREKAQRPEKTYPGVRAIHPQRQNNL